MVLSVHTKTTEQAGEGRQRFISITNFTVHSVYPDSHAGRHTVPCCVLIHMLGWLLVARAMRREGCSEHGQASTGHQPSTVNKN